MALDFSFAVVSDPHITLPQTMWDHPTRFHLVEVSIAAFESVLEHLCQLDLDFILIPGDLTQHGEPENHRWLAERLAQLPFPAYVVPGNHDVPYREATEHTIGLADFPHYYQKFGYQDPSVPYYSCEILPDVRLIALNSNDFDADGKLIGRLDPAQLAWLEKTLAQAKESVILVMVHHNIMDHLRGQSKHPWGRRYVLRNGPTLVHLLQEAGVELVFTGHLHTQNIARRRGVYDISTGSLVSYPHPYRILRFQQYENPILHIESNRVEAVPHWPTLQKTSLEWMAERSTPVMAKFLSSPPINLPSLEAERLAPDLRYFWAGIAAGDTHQSFPTFPEEARRFLETLSRSIHRENQDLSDNTMSLPLKGRKPVMKPS
jgi:predicted MPP superfamily phosphohydrolase